MNRKIFLKFLSIHDSSIADETNDALRGKDQHSDQDACSTHVRLDINEKQRRGRKRQEVSDEQKESLKRKKSPKNSDFRAENPLFFEFF
jgi:hypothetical protein